MTAYRLDRPLIKSRSWVQSPRHISSRVLVSWAWRWTCPSLCRSFCVRALAEWWGTKLWINSWTCHYLTSRDGNLSSVAIIWANRMKGFNLKRSCVCVFCENPAIQTSKLLLSSVHMPQVSITCTILLQALIFTRSLLLHFSLEFEFFPLMYEYVHSHRMHT